MSLQSPHHQASTAEAGHGPDMPVTGDVENQAGSRQRGGGWQSNGSSGSSRRSASPCAQATASMEAHIGWKRRIKHFTWTWFTMSMATGGIANVIHNIPFRFQGLYAIGCTFFLLNIVIFLFNVVMISCRFVFYPYTFRASFLHPTESLFIPASIVSLGTVAMNISQYGIARTGEWLDTAAMIIFWVESCLAMVLSFGIYLILWSTTTFTVAGMTPIWIFPAYPLLIIGPHAAILSATLSPERALQIIIAGFMLQGIGFLVSLTIYSAYINRLMTQKLPRESSRPGMFVSIGPSGFTVTGILGMAANLDRAFPADFMGDGEMAAFVLRVIGNWTGIWLWGLAVWFFFVSVFAHLSCVGRLRFSMAWYSFVFPNTALITATLAVGKAFAIEEIQILGTVMTVVLVGVWIFVVGMTIRAVWMRQILWPQQGEDRDEGGFKGRLDR